MRSKKVTFEYLVDLFQRNGYRLDYIRRESEENGGKFACFYKDFDLGKFYVEASDEVQVGRNIDIFHDRVRLRPFMQRGYYWANSAEVTSRKGNIWSHGDPKTIVRYKYEI